MKNVLNHRDTRYSNPVTHVSTNPARPSLTSVIGRELVYSRRYDANRKSGIKSSLNSHFRPPL